MSLQIRGWRRITEWVLIGLVVIFLAVFIIKTAVFEHEYYNSKEGSERATVASVVEEEEEEELIEVEPTPQEVQEYTVAADRPRYLSIDKLGVANARVIAMGVNRNGELATPYNIFDVGWYDVSGKPGEGGTLVIDGHNGGPHAYGVFKALPSLATGDLIRVERGDGQIFTYAVAENVEIPLENSDDYMITAMKSPKIGTESLTLISCSGDWSAVQKTYLSRQFVRAVLVE